MKTRFISFLFLTAISASLTGQEVIATTGGIQEDENGNSISFTLGETISSTLTNGDGITLTQGFQQPSFTISTVAENHDIDYSIKAYPNPADDYIILEVDKVSYNDTRFKLFDLNGRLLKEKPISGTETTIHFQEFTPGVYYLHVIDNQKIVKVLSVIKK